MSRKIAISCDFLKNKNPYRIYLTYEVSAKSVANPPKYKSPNLAIFTKKCIPLPPPPPIPVVPFFGNLGSHSFESLQWIFLKLLRLTKLGTINRFMEMNFCFQEKSRNRNFVTSLKRAIKYFFNDEIQAS